MSSLLLAVITLSSDSEAEDDDLILDDNVQPEITRREQSPPLVPVLQEQPEFRTPSKDFLMDRPDILDSDSELPGLKVESGGDDSTSCSSVEDPLDISGVKSLSSDEFCGALLISDVKSLAPVEPSSEYVISDVKSIANEESVILEESNIENEGLEDEPDLQTDAEIVDAEESLENFIMELNKIIKKKSEFKASVNQLRVTFKALELPTPEANEKLCRGIKTFTNEIIAHPKNKFKIVWKLLEYFDKPDAVITPILSTEQANSSEKPVGADNENNAESNEEKIEISEQLLERYEKLIKEWDEKDDSGEDEDDYNSPYLVRTRLVKRYLEEYKNWCKLNGFNTLTRRPTQMKVRIGAVTKSLHPQIEKAVEDFLNSRNSLFVPDYHDVLTIIQETKNCEGLDLSSEEIKRIALEIFQRVLPLLKKRREQDTNLVLGIEDGGENEVQDPAEVDAELAKKLDENKKRGKTEQEILKKFCEMEREENLAPEEVDIDLMDEDSGEESDDESDDSEYDEAESCYEEDEAFVYISDNEENPESVNTSSSRPSNNKRGRVEHDKSTNSTDSSEILETRQNKKDNPSNKRLKTH